MSLMKKSLIASSLAFVLTSGLYANESYTVNTTSLGEAIKQISKISKLPFIVDANILKGKHANKIKNVQSLKKALKLVLKNTGLEAVISDETIVIRKKVSKENEAEKLQSISVIGNQESYYNEYSSTSMKGEFDDRDIPYSTSVINDVLIKDIQALRLEDTYDYTTGVTKSARAADGIVIRGFDISLQNLQVDGMPGVVSRFGSPSTSNIEKVEIVKGPASVLYGNMETGGFVNVITKKPQAEDKVTVALSYSTYASSNSSLGSDNGFTSSFDATGTIQDGLYYRFITAGESLNSYRDDVKYKNLYVYPSLLWDMDDQTSLLFALEYGKEDGSADDGLVAIDNDISKVASINTVYQEKDDFDDDEGLTLDLKLEHNFLNDSVLNVAWRSVFHNDERKLYQNSKVNDSAQTLTRQNRYSYNERNWHSFDSNLRFKANTGQVVHNMTAGAAFDYRMTDYDRRIWNQTVSPDIDVFNPILGGTAGTNNNNRRKTVYKSGALYLQDKMDITDDLVFVASGRMDRTKIDFQCIRGESASCKDNSTNSTNFVGSLGVVYNLNSLVSVYSSIGQSYDPTTAERVDANGDGLDSSQSKQVEVGAKFNINEQFNTTLSFYKINKENVAEKVTANIYELIGEVESKGVEADIQWLPTKNWQVKAGYAFNKTEYISGSEIGNRPANTPKVTAFAFTRYNFPSKVFDGLLGVSTGLTYKDKTYTSSKEANAVELPSYTRWDMGIHYDAKDWTLSLNVENITDKVYYEYGKNDYNIYSGEPRKITLSFTKTF